MLRPELIGATFPVSSKVQRTSDRKPRTKAGMTANLRIPRLSWGSNRGGQHTEQGLSLPRRREREDGLDDFHRSEWCLPLLSI
jgi:hypothetical protein